VNGAIQFESWIAEEIEYLPPSFVRALNGAASFNLAVYRLEEHLREASPASQQRIEEQLARFKPTREDVLLTRKLREYVNEWIESGIHPSTGVETPKARNLKSDSLIHTWYELLTDNGFTVRFRKSGGSELHFPNRFLASMRFTEGESSAGLEALRRFFLFLHSDLRFTIAQCKRCRTYYELANPREFYKNGTHCRACKSRACATAITVEQRAKIDDRRLSIAREAHLGWSRTSARTRNNYRDEQDYIAEQLRRAGESLTRKWVSRNRRKIEIPPCVALPTLPSQPS
jgi:hypothetical protein